MITSMQRDFKWYILLFWSQKIFALSWIVILIEDAKQSKKSKRMCHLASRTLHVVQHLLVNMQILVACIYNAKQAWRWVRWWSIYLFNYSSLVIVHESRTLCGCCTTRQSLSSKLVGVYSFKNWNIMIDCVSETPFLWRIFRRKWSFLRQILF